LLADGVTCVDATFVKDTNEENGSCVSGFCDNDGGGEPDDDWCFTPTSTYYDSEDSDCELSTNLGNTACDEFTAEDYCPASNTWCDASCAVVDRDTSLAACEDTNGGCSAYSWLANGYGANSLCCGDDVGEDFNQTSAGGRSCCYNAGILADATTSGALLCSDGGLFDCGDGTADDSGVGKNIASGSCTVYEGLYCVGTSWTALIPDDCSGCTSGSACNSGLCVEGLCRAASDCPNRDGSGCSADTNAWNQASLGGVCTTTGCDQTDPVAANCAGVSCNFPTDNAYAACTESYSCDSETGGGNFAQDGLCSTAGCTTANYVFYDDTDYKAASAVVAADYTYTGNANGESCDSLLTNGNYVTIGMLTQSGCTLATGGTDVVRVDADNDYFTATCDSSIDLCDTDVTESLTDPFTAVGRCASNTCETSGTVCYTGVSYFSSMASCSDDDTCDDARSGTAAYSADGHVCSSACVVDATVVLDGACCSDVNCIVDHECRANQCKPVVGGPCSSSTDCPSGAYCREEGATDRCRLDIADYSQCSGTNYAAMDSADECAGTNSCRASITLSGVYYCAGANRECADDAGLIGYDTGDTKNPYLCTAQDSSTECTAGTLCDTYVSNYCQTDLTWAAGDGTSYQCDAVDHCTGETWFTGLTCNGGVGVAGVCNVDYGAQNKDSAQGYCESAAASCTPRTWQASLGIDSNPPYDYCCGNNGTSDDWTTYDVSLTTGTTVSCYRCLDGTSAGASTVYGNGYLNDGTNTLLW